MKDLKHVFTLLAAFGISAAYAQNVGIGESAPASKLSVKGNLSIGDGYATTPAPANGLIVEGVAGFGTNTPDASAILDLTSTGRGLLIPRMTGAERTAINSPAPGLMVFDKDANSFYFYNGTVWTALGATGATGPAGKGYENTSSPSPVSIGTGNKTFTVTDFGAYVTGSRLRAASAADPANKWMEGVLTSTNGTDITIAVDTKSGSGTYSDWHFSIAGQKGETGAAGAQGATGATGAQGAAGSNGSNGTNGATWLSGSSAPTGGQGAVNDFYIRTSNGTYYKKTGASSWTSQGSLKGATGATGATGAAGAAGAKGATGATGANGVAGAAGATGATGVTGATGATGATGTANAWLSGNGMVGNGQGNVGDWYLRTSNGYVYEKTGSNTWTYRMTLSGGGSGWSFSGNSISSGEFIGTTNSQSLKFKVNNSEAGYLGESDKNVFFGSNINYGGGGSYNIGIGYGATVYGSHTNSVAIGKSAQVQAGSGSSNNVAIGNEANVTGGSAYSNSIALGSTAQVQASNGISIGRAANTNSQYGLAIGDGAQAQASAALVIGKSAYSNASNGVAIGTSAQSQASAAVVVGYNAYSNGTSAIAIGGGSSATQAQGAYSIALGYKAYTNSQNAIAIGNNAQAQGTNALAVGADVYNGNANTIAIGNSSITSAKLNGATSTSYALVVGTNSTNGNGAYLTKGGTWTNASDRNLKEEIMAINPVDILGKIGQLEITRWKYKGTNEYHIGPMAQDFYALFSVGEDDKRISSIDPSGVALAAIKALNEKVQEQQEKIDALMKQLGELRGK